MYDFPPFFNFFFMSVSKLHGYLVILMYLPKIKKIIIENSTFVFLVLKFGIQFKMILNLSPIIPLE